MENSILVSIKKMLGIAKDYTHFDPDIIMHINTILAVLTQVGVGPAKGFRIEDDSATWNDFLSDAVNLEDVKTFMYLRVKLLFDPPLSTAVSEIIKQQAEELLWRISISAESENKQEEIQNGE